MTFHALIIDDDRDSITVLAQLLEHEGASYTAVSSPGGLIAADAQGAHIVFLDLDMPGMNGYEVFERLRGEFGVQAPIVAYTVNTNERATTRQAGFNGMFAKPLDAACFSENVQRILSGEFVWDC